MENLINPYPIKMFVFGNDTNLGNKIASYLQTTPAEYEIVVFPDMERIPHQTETVRGLDVFIILTSQNGEEIDKWLIDYLRFIYAIKSGSPHRITVVLPKSVHQRADVKNYKLRQPRLTSFYPDLMKTAGADYIITCKLHNPASCTMNPPMDNTDTTFLIVDKIIENFPDLSKIIIAATDLSGGKYFSRKVSNKLQVPLIITDKERNPITNESSAIKVYSYGEISEERTKVVFIDDIISTFGSMSDAADALKEKFSFITDFYAAATHADFTKKTCENIIKSKFKEVWITDTVPVKQAYLEEIKENGKEVVVISVAKLLAKVIDNVHNGRQISLLWE
ncbi:MAG: ribose-phosphate diphosphokinase [Candidatus Paceibacterota bacterium]